MFVTGGVGHVSSSSFGELERARTRESRLSISPAGLRARCCHPGLERKWVNCAWVPWLSSRAASFSSTSAIKEPKKGGELGVPSEFSFVSGAGEDIIVEEGRMYDPNLPKPTEELWTAMAGLRMRSV